MSSNLLPIGGTAIVGLTGGIGSGKSAVGNFFAELGAHRVDADGLARAAVEPPSPVLDAIFGRFGKSVRDTSGALDRKALGRIVFEAPDEKKWLEGMLHPHVRTKMTEAIAQAIEVAAPMIVLEVPLLFENKMQDWMHRTVLVTAPQDIRVARVIARDSLPVQDILARMAAQMPEEEKRRLAHHVIDNAASFEKLRREAEAVYNQILFVAPQGR